MEKKPLSPSEILASAANIGEAKAKESTGQLIVLGLLAGAFIAFGAAGSNTIIANLLMNPKTFGAAKCLQGALFTPGLMLVILAGAELFTGNTLMIVSAAQRRITAAQLLRVLIIVYFANMAGGVVIAFLVSKSGLLAGGANMVGAVTVKIAAGKTSLPFSKAFILGILCNWLVCLAVWMSWGADTTVGKIFSIFFPIWLFVASGFEHSVANMYYIPAGILAKAVPEFAKLSGVAPEVLATLTWKGFFLNNLLPVTLGNIVGGMVCVGLAYTFAYGKKAA